MSTRLKSAAVNAHAAFLALAVTVLIAARLEVRPFHGPRQVAACSKSGNRVAAFQPGTGHLSIVEPNSVVGPRHESITLPDTLTSTGGAVHQPELQFIGTGDTHLVAGSALVSLEDHSFGSLKGHTPASWTNMNEIRADSVADSFHVVAVTTVKINTYDLTPDFTRNTFTTPAAASRENFTSLNKIRVFEIRNRNRIAFSKGHEFFKDAKGIANLVPNFGFTVMDLNPGEVLFESQADDFLGFCGGGEFCVVASPGGSPEALEVWRISTGEQVASHAYGEPIAIGENRLIVLDGPTDMKSLSLPNLETTAAFAPPFDIPPKQSSNPFYSPRFMAAEVVPDDVLRVVLANGELHDLDLSGENQHRRIFDLWRSNGERWTVFALSSLGFGLLICGVATWRTRKTNLRSDEYPKSCLRNAIRWIWVGAGVTLMLWWFADTAFTTSSFNFKLSESWITLLSKVPYAFWLGSLPICFFALWRLLIWPVSRVWKHPPGWTDSRFHFAIGLVFSAVAAVAFVFNS